METGCKIVCNKTESQCENRDAALVCSWTKALLNHLENGSDTASAVRLCCKPYYDMLDMDRVLERFLGKPEAFYQFLHAEWNWIVAVDPDGKGLTADENKDACVCPLVRAGAADASLLCNCSVGFAEMMFAKVLQRRVKATIQESILRGGKHCVYTISFV